MTKVSGSGMHYEFYPVPGPSVETILAMVEKWRREAALPGLVPAVREAKRKCAGELEQLAKATGGSK